MTGGRTLFATRRRNVWCWALSLASLASVFSAVSVAVPLTPASGQAAPVARLLDLINQDRAQHGLGTVSLSGPLSAIAQSQANAMAGARRIFQNPAFPGDVPAANSAGENVGYGPDVDTVHNAFVASPEHQVIIVGPDYRVVGIAVASSPIGLMVVENFVEEPDRKLLRIDAVIVVAREAHKGMLIGAGGRQLKEIGTAARLELEKMLGAHVFLQLLVKVEKDWTRSPRKIAELGL